MMAWLFASSLQSRNTGFVNGFIVEILLFKIPKIQIATDLQSTGLHMLNMEELMHSV